MSVEQPFAHSPTRLSSTQDDRQTLLNREDDPPLEEEDTSATQSPWRRHVDSLRKTFQRQTFQRKLKRNIPILVLVTLILLAVVVVVAREGRDDDDDDDHDDGDEGGGRPGSAKGRMGVVSSENPACSVIGVDVLKEGGSATDAAIATSICIGVTNMYSSGIGGGGFMVVRRPGGASRFIDFREAAPAASHVDMFEKDPGLARIGGLAVGVPGEIRGFEAAHKLYGKLDWKRLFEPSVRMCKDGWEVVPVLAQRIAAAPDLMLNDPTFRAVFAPEGRLLVAGDTIRRPTYGDTLQEIANKGADVFYKGWIAEALVNTTQSTGGILTMDDMRNYTAKVQPTLTGFYHGKRVITAPPPASGAVLLSVLNVLEGYDLAEEGRTGLNIHRQIEAFKHGFAQRSYYGDPTDPIYTNITEIAHEFIEKKEAWEVRSTISDDTTYSVDHYNPIFDVDEDHGTMHVSVLTADGEAVSTTCTVNLLFGAQVMDAATGIILNDEMDDFSIPGVPNAFGLAPSPYNYIYPFKRPLSSSVPVIIESGSDVEIVAGASGGSRIITATAQAVIDMLSYGMTAKKALAQPRAHHQLLPNEVTVEYEFDDKLRKALTSRGHKIAVLEKGKYLTGVEVVKRASDGSMQGS
ncbi:hypothetical protein HKX48_006301 [Thoreauomyces humboldtii]|nr:hypothetical protein HKX48_006301 [Thoreauomyces humboldtii]